MRLAATVMLARDAADGVEFLMVRRSGRSSFAPDALVFPGGTVDPEDYITPPGSWAARAASEFRATVSPSLTSTESPISEEDALAVVCAAVRELREEADVEISPDDVYLFSQWITPPSEPRRYNTFFFVARAPDGALGTADAVETHEARWITAQRALQNYANGELHLVYPTIKHLERALAYGTTDALLAFAKSKPIITIMPWGAPSEGFMMPEELEGAW